MLNVLLLGNYTNEMWHQFSGCDLFLKKALGDIAVCTATEDYQEYDITDFAKYDAVLVHSLRFDLPEKTCRAIVEYVVRGGAFLSFHATILAFYPTELIQMNGAAFKMHPPFQTVQYLPSDQHPITKDVDPFALEEEPFQFDFAELTKTEVFLTYSNSAQNQPAGWCHPYGKGCVVYLQPGHTQASFENADYQKLIRNSVLWATGRLT